MKKFLEYFWYGIVLALTITFLQTKIYNVDFSLANVISFMILCPIAIWLTRFILDQFANVSEED